MKTVRCEEMMCDNCVARIQKALTEASVEHKVDLEHKTVTILEDGCEDRALEILDDLGFSAKETENTRSL